MMEGPPKKIQPQGVEGLSIKGPVLPPTREAAEPLQEKAAIDPKVQMIAQLMDKISGDARARLEHSLNVAGLVAVGEDGFSEAIAAASPEDKKLILGSALRLIRMPEEKPDIKSLIAKEVDTITQVLLRARAKNDTDTDADMRKAS